MQKISKAILIAMLLILSVSVTVSAASAATVNQLIEQEDKFDKAQVTVQGEAIGEILERGESSWVNISDGTNAIGIKMKTSEARKITRYGNYKQKGDVIRVTGIFHKACGEDGGETDVHALSMQITEPGGPVAEPVRPGEIWAAVLLAALAALCLLAFRKRRFA
jgi:hypothetical protein